MSANALMEFLAAVTEMCEAWDSLRAMLSGRDGGNLSLAEGRLEVVRRTKRMVGARERVAKAARVVESFLA